MSFETMQKGKQASRIDNLIQESMEVLIGETSSKDVTFIVEGKFDCLFYELLFKKCGYKLAKIRFITPQQLLGENNYDKIPKCCSHLDKDCRRNSPGDFIFPSNNCDGVVYCSNYFSNIVSYCIIDRDYGKNIYCKECNSNLIVTNFYAIENSVVLSKKFLELISNDYRIKEFDFEKIKDSKKAYPLCDFFQVEDESKWGHEGDYVYDIASTIEKLVKEENYQAATEFLLKYWRIKGNGISKFVNDNIRQVIINSEKNPKIKGNNLEIMRKNFDVIFEKDLSISEFLDVGEGFLDGKQFRTKIVANSQ